MRLRQVRRVTTQRPQAQQRGYDGRELKRWYVVLPQDRVVVTWAVTATEALEKRGGALRVLPAPALLFAE